MSNFTKLVQFLTEHGYNVEVSHHDECDCAQVKGQNIIAAFCNQNAHNPYLDGKIAVDHEDCFDKWQKCPLILSLPKNDNETAFLLKELRFWGTKDGYTHSNEYDADRYTMQYPQLEETK